MQLTTPRLTLRPFVGADAPKLYAMSTEAGLRRFIPDQVYRDVEDAEAVATALAALTAQPPDPRVRAYVLGIEHTATRVLVGHVGLSAARGSVEIGYAVEEQQQRTGVATEAVAAMSAWGIAELGLPEILGIVDVDNVSSRRVLEKAGYVRSGESTNGHGQPALVYRRAA